MSPRSSGVSWLWLGLLVWWSIAFQMPGEDMAFAQSTSPLPILKSVEEVRHLSTAQAALGYPVHLRCVVTYYDANSTGFFAQDSQKGIFVRAAGRPRLWHAGQNIDLEGKTEPGDFAVIIKALKITELGEGEMPPPKWVSFDQLTSGTEDTQWIETRGSVRSTSHIANGSVVLDLVINGVRVQALGPVITNDLSSLIECVVRLQGVAGTVFNRKRQMIAPIIFFNSLSNITAESEINRNPFAVPEKSVRQLFEYDSLGSSGHRVKIRGVVIGQLPGEAIFIRDKQDGLLVETKDQTLARPGDIVETLGFPATGRFNPILQDAVFRKTGTGAVPNPVMSTVPELLVGTLDADLVTVEADLQVDWNGRDEPFMKLQENGIMFNAAIATAHGALPWPSLRAGSRLKLTGICQVQEVVAQGSWLHPSFIRLLLRSPQDIVVLSHPSWWTATRLLWLLGGVMIFALTAAVWGILLKRRMLDQAETIRTQLKREGVLNERARIAREFHDTLEQELAGMSLQLDMIATQTVNHPVAERIGIAQRLLRRSQEEAHRSVWDLRCGALERGGLAVALRETAEQAARRAGIEITLNAPYQSRQLPVLLEHHLLRISQEAITNAIRHGSAKKIQLDLSLDAVEICLRIKDDGCGFALEWLSQEMAGHFGLLGMKERAEKIGGSFNVVSQPGLGTQVIVKAPVPQDNDNIADSGSVLPVEPAILTDPPSI